MSTLKTTVRASVLVARRRARHDLVQLITTASLVALTTLLAVLVPGVVLGTLDAGAQDSIERAGARADIVAEFSVAEAGTSGQSAAPDAAAGLADGMAALLPRDLAAVNESTTLTVRSSETEIRAVDATPWAGEGQLMVQLAMLTPQNTSAVDVVEGRLPAADGESPIEVVLSTEAAAAADLRVGSLLQLGTTDDAATALEIVGLVDGPRTGDEELWEDLPELWSPRQREASVNGLAQTRFTVLVSPAGIGAAAVFLNNPVIGTVRLRADPALYDSDLVASTISDATALAADGQVLAGSRPVLVSVRSELAEALRDYPANARAALAQMSLMMAGVLGVAAVALILLSRLLVLQRAAAVALERARGASILSIGLRSGLESLAVTAAGSAVGLGIAALVSPGGLRDPFPVLAVVGVAILAAPVQSMAIARALWTGRRDPANRRDRELLARKRRRQRLVIEAAVIAVAAASLIAIRGRGLLQNRTGGIDPLLAAAPLLLAIAVTIVLIRVYPYPIRAIGAVAQRTRGVLGLLGSVRARSAIAALPLLALALGAALSVTGAMLVDTVRGGQDEAAWQRVGADARIDAELDGADAAALRASPGVDAVSATRAREGVALDLGTTTATITVLAVDEFYPDVVDAVPGQPDAATLRLLTEPGEPLPIVVDRATAERLLGYDIAMYFGPSYIPLTVVGTSDVAPDGYVDGPFAFVNLERLNALLPEERPANQFLLVGSGAAAAADRFSDQALTRTGWIEDRRSLALVAGVERSMVFAVVAVSLLAVIALVATVVGGARARGRALSMLRTLGMRPRLGWWLALAELGPLIVAAVLGGIAAGLVATVTLAPAIGLDVLTGGLGIPTTSLSPVVFAALIGAGMALLLIGALADVLVHRRDKLSEVLRVGETV